MNLCSETHEEIVYEGRVCPICGLLAEKDAEISNQSERITELEGALEAAEAAIADS
jgi:hypothetical protein